MSSRVLLISANRCTAPDPVFPLGLAHINAALRQAGKSIKPIFAQQSIREMTRTQRTPAQVMGDALRAMEAAGYTSQHGADADHLKVPEDVDRTAAAGFTFFTIDPSDDVDVRTEGYAFSELQDRFSAVKGEVDWFERYRGRRITLGTGTVIDLTDQAVMRAAVKYGRAINRAVKMSQHIDSVHKTLGRAYEIELSVDETPQPAAADQLATDEVQPDALTLGQKPAHAIAIVTHGKQLLRGEAAQQRPSSLHTRSGRERAACRRWSMAERRPRVGRYKKRRANRALTSR